MQRSYQSLTTENIVVKGNPFTLMIYFKKVYTILGELG